MSVARAVYACLLALCGSAAETEHCKVEEASTVPAHGVPPKALMQAYTKSALRQPFLVEQQTGPAVEVSSFSNPQQDPLFANPTGQAPQFSQVQQVPQSWQPQAQPALDETTFQSVKQQNSEDAMTEFVKKVIEDRGGGVCDQQSLQGLVRFYTTEVGVTYQNLLEEIHRAADGSCPWVGTQFNGWCTTNGTIGATATIDESGYAQVKNENCFAVMRRWVERAAGANGYHICSDGALSGLTMYYYRPDSPANYSWLQHELVSGAATDCPWLVRLEWDCPATDDNGQCTGPPVQASKKHLFLDNPGTPASPSANAYTMSSDMAASRFDSSTADSTMTASGTSSASSASRIDSTDNSESGSYSSLKSSSSHSKEEEEARAIYGDEEEEEAIPANNNDEDEEEAIPANNDDEDEEEAIPANDQKTKAIPANDDEEEEMDLTSSKVGKDHDSSDEQSTVTMDKQDEETFKALKKENDKGKMAKFIKKLMTKAGYQLCAEGGLQGLLHFYVGPKYPTATFKRLMEEIAEVSKAPKCPWVVKKGKIDCPETDHCWK